MGLKSSIPGVLTKATDETGMKEEVSALMELAFKASPMRNSLSSIKGQDEQGINEWELVSSICEDI